MSSIPLLFLLIQRSPHLLIFHLLMENILLRVFFSPLQRDFQSHLRLTELIVLRLPLFLLLDLGLSWTNFDHSFLNFVINFGLILVPGSIQLLVFLLLRLPYFCYLCQKCNILRIVVGSFCRRPT